MIPQVPNFYAKSLLPPSRVFGPLVRYAIAATLLGSCSIRLMSQLSISNTPPLGTVPTVSVEIKTIPVELPPGEISGKGGIIAADVNGDQQLDFLVTQPEFIAAYGLENGQLWKRTADIRVSDQAEREGLPGRHGSAIQAGDIDGDGKMEVFYIIQGNVLEVLSAETGELKHSVQLPPIESSFDQWEHVILANFLGEGDNEVLLQSSQNTNRDGYIRDSVQAAFSLTALIESEAETQPLWLHENFVSLSHGSARVVDINEDGKDEVVGATILSPAGEVLYSADISNTSFPHLDSIAVDDIDPTRPGLEAIVPEEGGKKRVILFDERGEVWSNRHREKSRDMDGDKVVVGNFDVNEPGLEIWFRGNDSDHFTVLNSSGKLLASYAFSNRQPENWTDKGFEVIHRIHWTGEPKEYIATKERHEVGDVGIFDATNGQLMAQFPAATERLYVADVIGDWREELVILENDKIKIIQNAAPNPYPTEPRLWEKRHYHRQKMTWNYYSP